MSSCYICGCRTSLSGNVNPAYECVVEFESFTIHKLVCKSCCDDYDNEPLKIENVVRACFSSDDYDNEPFKPVNINVGLNYDLAIEIQNLIVRRTRPIPEAGDHPAIPYIPHDLGLDILELLKERLGVRR